MMSPTSGTSLKEAARVVFSLDDLCDEFDPWEPLHALKEKYPGLRVTLFAIPARCSDGLLARYRALDWVELGVHGYHHALRECLVWGFEETMEKLEELVKKSALYDIVTNQVPVKISHHRTDVAH